MPGEVSTLMTCTHAFAPHGLCLRHPRLHMMLVHGERTRQGFEVSDREHLCIIIVM